MDELARCSKQQGRARQYATGSLLRVIRRGTMVACPAWGLALLLLFLIPAPMAWAGEIAITVARVEDSYVPANCESDLSNCSLREAITVANQDPDNDYTIVIPSGIYTLTRVGAEEGNNATGDLDLLRPMTLTGEGLHSTVIDGNGIDRVLHVHPGARVSIGYLLITGGGGVEEGGGILNDGGQIMFEATEITWNKANRGAGLANRGGQITTKPAGFRVTRNESTGNGGGIYNDGGQMELLSVAVYSNRAEDTGGGIYNGGGVVTLQDGSVLGNIAIDGGGGIYNGGGVVTLQGGSVGSNMANFGAGLANIEGQAAISNTWISSNSAYFGGGIATAGDSAVVTIGGKSRILNNVGYNGGGGFHIDGGGAVLTDIYMVNNQAGSRLGGAIYQHTGTVVIRDSCLVRNGDVALHIAGGTTPLQATRNWWGTPSGPSGEGPGNGDSVDGNVDYADFFLIPLMDCPSYSYRVGGVVTGLGGSGLVLFNNGEILGIAADGEFMFLVPQIDGALYDVKVENHPMEPRQICTVSNGQGLFAGAHVTDVVVTCVEASELFLLYIPILPGE